MLCFFSTLSHRADSLKISVLIMDNFIYKEHFCDPRITVNIKINNRQERDGWREREGGGGGEKGGEEEGDEERDKSVMGEERETK